MELLHHFRPMNLVVEFQVVACSKGCLSRKGCWLHNTKVIGNEGRSLCEQPEISLTG